MPSIISFDVPNQPIEPGINAESVAKNRAQWRLVNRQALPDIRVLAILARPLCAFRHVR